MVFLNRLYSNEHKIVKKSKNIIGKELNTINPFRIRRPPYGQRLERRFRRPESSYATKKKTLKTFSLRFFLFSNPTVLSKGFQSCRTTGRYSLCIRRESNNILVVKYCCVLKVMMFFILK